jgi:DNA helicase-2/ATP-dependent DNA helicase PcrA
MAAEPSQFLNEMPLELIDDLSQSASWLSYARSSSTIAAKAAVSALRGEDKPEKQKSIYSGKTYNSSEAVAEFFKQRSQGNKTSDEPKTRTHPTQPAQRPVSGYDKLRAIATPPSEKKSDESLVPGAYVKHEKYGRGLVLRREGSGDNAKLTVSFPGFGQKKLIEKYANLQKV